MAWLAVDLFGNEYIFTGKPTKGETYWNENDYWDEVELPKGSIKKLIGYELTWEDEPIEI